MALTGLALFVIMVLVVFVARSVIQKRLTGDTGIRAGAVTAKPFTLEWVAGWALIAAFLAGIAAPIAELAGLDPWTNNTAIRSIGIAITLVGIALTFASQLSMGTNGESGSTPTNAPTSSTTAPSQSFATRSSPQ